MFTCTKSFYMNKHFICINHVPCCRRTFQTLKCWFILDGFIPSASSWLLFPVPLFLSGLFINWFGRYGNVWQSETLEHRTIMKDTRWKLNDCGDSTHLILHNHSPKREIWRKHKYMDTRDISTFSLILYRILIEGFLHRQIFSVLILLAV